MTDMDPLPTNAILGEPAALDFLQAVAAIARSVEGSGGSVVAIHLGGSDRRWLLIDPPANRASRHEFTTE